MAFVMVQRRHCSVLLPLIRDFHPSNYIRKILKAYVEIILEIQKRDQILSQNHITILELKEIKKIMEISLYFRARTAEENRG